MKTTLVTIGTAKGAFFFSSDASRSNWTMTGPHLPGWDTSAIYVEPRAGGRIYLGTTHFAYGPTIRVSDDAGATWRQMENRPAYAKESGFKLNKIWQLVGHPTDPDTIYAGVDEAGLFVSRDRAETWTEISSLTDRPDRPHWMPGAGGLCLHTIVIDPNDPRRMWVGISAVGIFRTTDAGQTWTPSNVGLPNMDTGNSAVPSCYCIHKIVLDPASSDTLYMQFHGGVFKSTDAALTWQPIESGLPGNFGFPIGISRRGELFLAPLESDATRVMKNGQLRIYRSRDGGGSWLACGAGLPDGSQFVGVLRDALAVDRSASAGVYFGTTMGDLFFSNDAGDSWRQMPGRFPRIEVVKVTEFE